MTGVPAVDRSDALQSPAAWTADPHDDWRLALADRASQGLNLALAGLIATQYLLGIVGVWIAWVHHVRTLQGSH